MKYGLSEEQLAEIIAFIKGYPEVEEAILFGSRAIDTYKEASDIDIAIKGEKVTAGLAATIKFDLEEDTFLPFFFDVLAYPSLTNAALIEHIDNKGVRLFGGDVGGEWVEYKLGDVLEIKYGKDHKKLNDGIIPVYGSGGIMRYADTALYDEESILIPRKGTLNNIFYLNKPFWTVDTLFYTKPNKSLVNIKFLYYQLSEIDFNALNVGSAVPSLTVSVLNDVLLYLPELPEQKAIANVLSSLDDKIDLLHRQNKTLEAMAETLFRQWFIEEAKEDWEKNTFEKWISNTFGGDWGKEFPDKDYIVPAYCIRGTDIADLQYGLAKKTPIRYITERKFGIVEPQNGDIILEISGGTENQSTGRSIYIDKNITSLFCYPLVFSNFCRLLRPKNEKFTYFVFLYLQYLYKQDEFFNLENGSSGIKNLNYKALLFELSFTMPNENRVLAFDDKVSVLFHKINKNKSQIQTLEKLRDNLLPKLMSGEVRVAYDQQDAA